MRQDFSRRVRIGINASWAVNITLLIAKIVAFFLSMSYSVLASAVDSLVDLLSQAGPGQPCTAVQSERWWRWW